MTILSSLIEKEEERNRRMIDAYQEELDRLPQGSITAKTISGKRYYYLSYRSDGKVVTKYLGKEEALGAIRDKLDRRAQIESILKSLREEQAKIKKMEALL